MADQDHSTTFWPEFLKDLPNGSVQDCGVGTVTKFGLVAIFTVAIAGPVQCNGQDTECGGAFQERKASHIEICRGIGAAMALHDYRTIEIGKASCRERVCKYEWISVVAVTLNKKK